MTIEELFASLTEANIESYIANGQEEHLLLDFKTVESSDLLKGNDKRTLATALSGFANSSGGIVVWGVVAKKNAQGMDVAFDKKLLDNVPLFITRLNELTGTSVSPIVDSVQHRALSGGSSGFAVSLIPESATGPHMAKAGEDRFYKRSGASFYRMEHFDIADMFGRRRRPELIVETRILQGGYQGGGGHTAHMGKLIVALRNRGRGVAKSPYLALRVSAPYVLDNTSGIAGTGPEGLPRLFHAGPKNTAKYGGSAGAVIHPQVLLDVALIPLQVSVDHQHRITLPKPVIIDYEIAAEDVPLVTGQQVVSEDEIARSVLPESVYRGQ